MNTAALHYDAHLGPVYAWMIGDLRVALARCNAELEDMGLPSAPHLKALDLGAGLGLHAVALAMRGFSVTAIDGCRLLLEDLRTRAAGLPVTAVLADLLEFRAHAPHPCDVILCMGDTLTHLPSIAAVDSLLHSVAAALTKQGMFAATFRDYAGEPPNLSERCILVKRDQNRILTCFLDYAAEHVTVRDVLTEREEGRWVQRESSYLKLRLAPHRVLAKLEALGLRARRETAPSGMVRIVARAPSNTITPP
jgi:2-polyprenyl-3-methyl-5-hydroxy-6-metoxy-1,4-benzoquinol methylase